MSELEFVISSVLSSAPDFCRTQLRSSTTDRGRVRTPLAAFPTLLQSRGVTALSLDSVIDQELHQQEYRSLVRM